VAGNRHFKTLNFRLQAGKLRDRVTIFLRGGAHMLLFYKSKTVSPLSFGASTRRGL
jgi:hypothetical protein